jgi:hypothetical protein
MSPVHLVSRFLRVQCFLIIGRVEELVARRKLVIASPVELPLDPDVVLDPNAAQDLDRRDFTGARQGHLQRRYLLITASHLDR